MKGYRFYLEFPTQYKKKSTPVKQVVTDLEKGKEPRHAGTIIACFLRADGWFEHDGKGLIDCISSVANVPNGPVCFSQVSMDYLQEKCKRVPENLARKIHPAMFSYIKSMEGK